MWCGNRKKKINKKNTCHTTLNARTRSDCTLISHHTKSKLCKLKNRSNKLHIANFNGMHMEESSGLESQTCAHRHKHTHTLGKRMTERQVRRNCYNKTHDDNLHSLSFFFCHLIFFPASRICACEIEVMQAERTWAIVYNEHPKRRGGNYKWKRENSLKKCAARRKKKKTSEID